ncbi:MAG: trypsin-like peptidase domain-containing protein, partial [Actinomycetota bacterium]
GRRAGLAALAIAALAAAGGVGALTATLVRDPAPATDTTGNRPVSTTPTGLLSLPTAIATVEPSVVLIQGGAAQGSGVITAPRGLIVTNEHVVSGETTVTVITADERRIPARVAYTDPSSDLAVLQTTEPPGPGVAVADEPDAGLRQGDQVFAIGSPFGLQNTVTVGIVSALGRRGERGQPVVQTDTAINPGNSGGGLFDMRGRLVGIPTEIRSPVEGNVGIGFAVTAERVRDVLDRVP